MKTIWKYPIEIKDTWAIDMPEGAQILHLEDQFMWVYIPDTKARQVMRTFRTFLTGQDLPVMGNMRYLGTIVAHFGSQDSMVWHIFEEKA